MKRSDINFLILSATRCFQEHGWTLPPEPRWDVTDFGLGNWKNFGLVLVNLAEEPEYCEKLMYALDGMTTPEHCHHQKKEDIICRWGRLAVQVWPERPDLSKRKSMQIAVDQKIWEVPAGTIIELEAGSRITLVPYVYHQFYPLSPECIIGEVSTANDDLHDNFFINQEIGRYPGIEENESPLVQLVSEVSL